MPLDILGCTRNTMEVEESMSYVHFGVTNTQLPDPKGLGKLGNPSLTGIVPCKWYMNGEYLVDAIHQIASNTSLNFVHTARRFIRHDRIYEANGDALS